MCIYKNNGLAARNVQLLQMQTHTRNCFFTCERRCGPDLTSSLSLATRQASICICGRMVMYADVC